MGRVRELYDKHPNLTFSADRDYTTGAGVVRTNIAIVYDADAGTKYVRMFVPEIPDADSVVAAMLTGLHEFLDLERTIHVGIGVGAGEDAVSSDTFRFLDRVLVYTEADLPAHRWENLSKQMEAQGGSMVVRDPSHARLQDKYQKPLAFLSHDSRDKDAFVRPLAQKLSSMLCPVWYDEYTLVPGQSLRESIERGLKECPKCVVVLSPNFFANEGWSKREFETVYQREILQKRRVMVPVWLGVTKEQVYDYSPILLDTFGIDGGLGVEGVAKKVLAALEWEPPVQLLREGSIVQPGQTLNLSDLKPPSN